MKARVFSVVAVSAMALLVSGCGVVSLGGGGLSSECRDAVDAGASEFVSTAADLGGQVEAGELGAGDSPDISVLEPALERIGEACGSESQEEALSMFIVKSKEQAEKQSGSDIVQATVYGAIDGFCDSAGSGGLSEEARSACDEAGRTTNEFLSRYQSGSQDGSQDGSSGGSSGDGFAIDDVETDLDFPGGSSGGGDLPSTLGSNVVTPYELTYVVDGVGTAFVTYITGDDRSKSEEVVLPWQFTATSQYDYSSVSATGDSSGQLSCAIYHDGAEVNKSTDTSDVPFVSCYNFK